jgi:hypothetical protein
MEELHFNDKNVGGGWSYGCSPTFDFQGGEDVKPDKMGE